VAFTTLPNDTLRSKSLLTWASSSTSNIDKVDVCNLLYDMRKVEYDKTRDNFIKQVIEVARTLLQKASRKDDLLTNTMGSERKYLHDTDLLENIKRFFTLLDRSNKEPKSLSDNAKSKEGRPIQFFFGIDEFRHLKDLLENRKIVIRPQGIDAVYMVSYHLTKEASEEIEAKFGWNRKTERKEMASHPFCRVWFAMLDTTSNVIPEGYIASQYEDGYTWHDDRAAFLVPCHSNTTSFWSPPITTL
jgi:hypothetical protein